MPRIAARHGYAIQSIPLENLHENGLLIAGSCRLDHGTDGLGDSALFADDLAHIIRTDAQLNDDSGPSTVFTCTCSGCSTREQAM